MVTYVKLNDFFAKEGISMDDFMPATVVGYLNGPKNTPNYWALPAMATRSAGPIARTGSPPEIQAGIQKKNGRDLALLKLGMNSN